MASAGGAGVGGWQIYEETNPTVDKQLSRQGYSYKPLSSPLESDSAHEKFEWKNWGCMQKLFPTITINQQSSGLTLDSFPNDADWLSASPVKDDLVVCAMMDIRPITLDSNYSNRIYFKSEVVVRGDSYGWVMWTGLSTVRKTGGSSVGELNFEYRLILLKKEQDAWKEIGGYSWYNFHHDTGKSAKFFIKTPIEEWWLKGSDKSSPDIPRKTWTGMAKVDTDHASENKDLLQSIHVYLDNITDSEFFGNDGNFSGTQSEGFTGVSQVYLSKDNEKGWRAISSGRYKDLSSSLKTWYAPLKGKKLKWSDLKDIQSQCYYWSSRRNHTMSNADKLWQDICYSKN